MNKKIKIILVSSLIITFGYASNVLAATKNINSTANKSQTIIKKYNTNTGINQNKFKNLPPIKSNLSGNKLSYSNSFTNNSTLPSSVDNSTSSYFPMVIEQKFGDCVENSVVYYQMSFMESQKLSQRLVFSPKFIYNLVNNGDSYNGNTDINTVYKYLTMSGSPLQSVWPYDNDYLGWPTNESVWRSALKYKIDSYCSYLITDQNNPQITGYNDSKLTSVKNALNLGYVLTYNTNIEGWNITTAKNGEKICYGVENKENKGVDHSMCIVGYDDDVWVDINGNGKVDPGEKGAFKVLNPWGNAWKEAGGAFCWVSYDALNKVSVVQKSSDGKGLPPINNRISVFSSGIDNNGENQVFALIPGNGNYKPKYLLRVTAKSSDRERFAIYMHAKDRATGEIYTYSPITNYVGNSLYWSKYAFDGTTNPCYASFAFDITDIATKNIQRGQTTIEFMGSNGDVVNNVEIDDGDGNSIFKYNNPIVLNTSPYYIQVQ